MRPNDKPPTILICDDDELILGSLRGLFLLETDYEVLEFADPIAAAEEVQRRPVDLVISDFLMPQMNGVELLKRVREAQPDCVRMLLTGFADKENAIRAINEVGIYQYLEKPWDNENLLLLVRNALSERRLRGQLALKVAEFNELIDRHSRLSDRHASLERELEMAARVQRSLLPADPPEFDGYSFASHFQPSSALGGDFFDVLRRGENTIVMLADVSGHGVTAALTSILLKAGFDDASRSSAGPAELLDAMNQQLLRFLPGGMYACAAVLWQRRDSEGFELSNAGLPHPRVLRADGRVDELPAEGMPLGLFSDRMSQAQDVKSLQLAPGDLLLLATDGLGEAQNAGGEFFETQMFHSRLAALAGRPPEQVMVDLAGAATEFNAADSLADDLTMVSLQKR